MNKCKYVKKCSVKGYVTCDRDNSRRKATLASCHCPHYELSWWQKFKNRFFR